MNTKELAQLARKLRIEIINSIHKAGSGHAGGSLSAADIMTVLYFDKMNVRPNQPDWPERDRFVLSKGHAAPVLYSILAMRGYYPVEELCTLRQMGSRLSGHPACFKTPGVEISSGSLGQGLSVGLGMRLAGALQKQSYRVFVLIGDGELQEGEVWEAAMAAAHFKVKGLVAIVDYNRVQLDGTIDEIMEVEPLKEKWSSFGWKVISAKGHDVGDLKKKLDEAIRDSENGPVVVIARTVKGKGVSFMENKAEWHGKVISDSDYKQAMSELKNGGAI